MSLSNVKHIVLILSGKGGVGKSSTTLQLALSLTHSSHSVGILDADLTGPSMPHLLNLSSSKVTQAPGGWLPIPVHASAPATATHPATGSFSAMSLGFLLPSTSSAVIWRGPKKTAMIRQLLTSVLWAELDFLLIDTPPGTSDEHIALAETLLAECAPGQVKGAVVVTTPQAVATADVRKELGFCEKVGLPVLGVVENMAGFACPCCGEVTRVFGEGGGELMSREKGVRFLGRVPVDPGWGRLVEEGKAEGGEAVEAEAEAEGVEQKKKKGLGEMYRTSLLAPAFRDIAAQVVGIVEGRIAGG
jgi:Mrp family chromosome partitioning ATPase